MKDRRKKNPAAVALGRLGGKARAKSLTPEEIQAIGRAGGQIRTESLTPEERQEIARLAGQASGKARAANARKKKKG